MSQHCAVFDISRSRSWSKISNFSTTPARVVHVVRDTKSLISHDAFGISDITPFVTDVQTDTDAYSLRAMHMRHA